MYDIMIYVNEYMRYFDSYSPFQVGGHENTLTAAQFLGS